MKRAVLILSTALFAAAILPSVRPAIAQEKRTLSQGKIEATKRLEDDSQAQARYQLLLRVTSTLGTTSEDAKTWKDAGVAARVQAKVADLLWEADPDAARYHLIQAWETTGRVEEKKKERSSFRNESARNDVRRVVLLVARKRVPALAKQWLDEMARAAADEEKTQSRGAFDDRTARSTVLLQMALQIANDNPQSAAELAIESLQDGVSFGFQEVLLKLQEKNFDVAQVVFRAALARLRTGITDPNELLILYSYLYAPGRIVAPATSDNRGNIQLAVGRDRPHIVAAASQLNPALATEFLNLAADLLLALPLPASTADPQLTARTQISVINALLTELARQMPEKAMALRTRALQIDADAHFSTAESSPRPDLPERRDGEKASDYQDRRVDALVDAAGKEGTSLGRDIAYAKAALATNVVRYERGLDLARKINDESLRSGVSNWLIYRGTLHLINTGDYEKAYRLNSKSTEPLQRAACLVAGAQKSLKEKDRDLVRARQWLEEALSLTAKADGDENRSRVAFGIVSTYGQFDRPMALRSLSDAVRWLNHTELPVKDEDSAPLVKRFSGFANLSDFTYGTSGFSFEAAIKVFGQEQFDEVLSIINTISSRETRGMGVVLLCEQNLKAISPSDVAARTAAGKQAN